MAKIIMVSKPSMLWLAITAAMVTVAISDQIITVNLTVAPPPSSLVSGFINITNVGSGNLTLAKPPSSLVSGYTNITNLGSGNLTIAKPPSSLVSGSINITNVGNLTGNTGSTPSLCGANVVGGEGCGKLTPGNLQINITVTNNITLSVNATATPGVPIKLP